MRIAVLGNSDTTGQRLQPGEQPWTALIRPRLEEALHEEVTVESWKFAAYRPGALEYALQLVDASQPDVVIVPLASYWCAYSTTQTRLEHRFGKRIASLVARAEEGFVHSLEPRRAGTRRRRRSFRRVFRKVVGTEALISVPQFIHIYSSLIRELARSEDCEVLVLGDHHFNERMRRTMPGIVPAIDRFEAEIRPLVEERRMRWGDLEAAITTGGRREEMILGDGVHMTPEAHERVAALLVPQLAGILGREPAAAQ